MNNILGIKDEERAEYKTKKDKEVTVRIKNSENLENVTIDGSLKNINMVFD